jgi:hypothetical protein
MTAAIRRATPGQWADRPAVDTRVSRAEQDDHQIEIDDPDTWLVVLLCLSPILVPCAVSLVAAIVSNF